MVPAKYNFQPQVRGDSINSRTITILIDSTPAEIASSTMNIRNSQGKLIHNVPLTIVDNVITIPEISGSVTSTFPVQTLKHDIQVTLTNGKVRTYIQGLISIKQDYSYV